MQGHKVYPQDGREVPDGLLCFYCRLVMKDPVQTTQTGHCFCRVCFDSAQNDPNIKFYPGDEARSDSHKKREIDNLNVKCDNYMFGCRWTGLYKELTEHTDMCQFVTEECKNPGCGEQMLMSELDMHLKEKCLYRQVECKDCGKKMVYTELKEHTELCPNAPKFCGNCKKKLSASQVDSDNLKDTSELDDHSAPTISEFSKMSLAFQEMTAAYQQLVKRVEDLEIKNKSLENSAHQLNEKLALLENKSGEYETLADILRDKVEACEKHIEIIDKQNAQLTEKNVQLQENLFSAISPRNSDQLDAQVNSIGQQIQHLQQRITMTEKNWTTTREDINSVKSSNTNNYSQNVQQQPQQTVAIKQKVGYGGEVVPIEKPPSVKQVEDKVLEIERTLNALSLHHSELELQLQASLISTHNGTFVWRIAEVSRKVQDAKSGRITSIYSPPFYTGRNGYKMCIRAYLNGDGTGEGTHLSFFFVLMRGEYDPLLQWPFEPRVSLIFVDQDHLKHVVQSFIPDPHSSSFKRPVSDMNVASGCPNFAKLSVLDHPSYVKEDVMYIKAIVDISKIFHP